MIADDPIHVELELQPSGDRIEGRLVAENGLSVSFAGWLELIAALEEARSSTSDRSTDDG